MNVFLKKYQMNTTISNTTVTVMPTVPTLKGHFIAPVIRGIPEMGSCAQVPLCVYVEKECVLDESSLMFTRFSGKALKHRAGETLNLTWPIFILKI